MPALTVQTDATVLLRRSPTEKHVPFTVIGVELGCVVAHQRTGARQTEAALDLFDDADLTLTSSNQGRTWFVTEVRPRKRRGGVGRSYERLRAASRFAEVVARNPVAEDGRAAVVVLVRQAMDAFESSALPPDVVGLKALFAFARGEGYPVRQEWMESLSSKLRPEAERLLRSPLSDITESPTLGNDAARLVERLEEYLRAHTEILVD